MAFTETITIDTVDFTTVAIKPTSTLRSNPLVGLSEGEDITISHETSKAGRVSSVVFIDYGHAIPCSDTCGTSASISKNRAQFKLSYDPLTDVADIKAELTDQITVLRTFLNDPANIVKLLNKEH